jgi:hypothetical protein
MRSPASSAPYSWGNGFVRCPVRCVKTAYLVILSRDLSCQLVLTLPGSEHRIVHWVKCIVEEAYAVVDFDEERELAVPDQPFRLGLAVLHIWSRFLQGNTQWKFVNNLGTSLEKYTKMLTG